MPRPLSILPRARKSASSIPAYFLYGEPLPNRDERTVHVETIAARSKLHEWQIRPHRHRNLHQALLLQRGRVSASIDEQESELIAPAVLVVPAGRVHSFRFQTDTIGIVVSFSTDLARELAEMAPGLAQFLETPATARLARRALSATDLRQLSAMLLREFSRSAQGRELALTGLLSSWIANLMRLMQISAADHGRSAPRDLEIVARYRQLIEQRYREHPSVEEFAKDLGISVSCLRKACLTVAAQSPVELIHHRLLVEAERQLHYTSMSVTEVAYFLGFEDPAYFSRFFTRLMRTSPRGFRDRAHK
jgi:AraC family transcriptional regulator, transcriptional activator of pobA